jgi:histidine ammonia-lyase
MSVAFRMIAGEAPPPLPGPDKLRQRNLSVVADASIGKLAAASNLPAAANSVSDSAGVMNVAGHVAIAGGAPVVALVA